MQQVARRWGLRACLWTARRASAGARLRRVLGRGSVEAAGADAGAPCRPQLGSTAPNFVPPCTLLQSKVQQVHPSCDLLKTPLAPCCLRWGCSCRAPWLLQLPSLNSSPSSLHPTLAALHRVPPLGCSPRCSCRTTACTSCIAPSIATCGRAPGWRRSGSCCSSSWRTCSRWAGLIVF